MKGRGRLRLGEFHSRIEERWRLIHCPQAGVPGGAFDALFDLARDPDCRVDVSSEQPEVVARMRGRVLDWLEQGRKVRPSLVPPAEGMLEQLRELGYLEEGE